MPRAENRSVRSSGKLKTRRHYTPTPLFIFFTTMKNFIQNNYHKHLIFGALIGIVISIVLHLFSYDNASINLIVGSFVGFIAGVLWEGEQTYRHQHVNWDWKDVMWSAIGALVGSLIITLIF